MDKGQERLEGLDGQAKKESTKKEGQEEFPSCPSGLSSPCRLRDYCPVLVGQTVP